MVYKKISQSKVSDAIEQRLESLILEGTLRPGEKLLPERELAKKFDVSRPSLREAMHRLEAKGLIERKQGGGTFIKSALWKTFSDPLMDLMTDRAEYRLDFLETRYALEGIVAYFAALRATEHDIELVKKKHAAIAEHASSISEESAAIIEYLVVLAEAAHNTVLLHLIHSLVPILTYNVFHILELLHQSPDVYNIVNMHRKDILNAIIERSPEKAKDASNQHLAFIEHRLIELDRAHDRKMKTLRRLQKSIDEAK